MDTADDTSTTKRKLEECGSQPAKKLCVGVDGNINNNNQLKDNLNLKALMKSRSVESYSKLHRLDKLVSSLIMALRNTAGSKEVPFPSKLTKKWCDAFSLHMNSLSSPQIINIFRSLLWSLNEDCIKPLENNPLDTDCLRILPTVTQLLSLYLSKVHMAEHTVPAIMVTKFVGHMDELKHLLGRLGGALLNKEHDQALMAAFLSSCLSWGDMHVLMLQYRPQDELTDVWNSTSTDSSATNFSGFHSYLSSDQWSLVAQRITNFGDLICKCFLNQLVVQKFEVLVLFASNSCANVVSAAARHLVTSIDDGWPQVLGDNGCLLTTHLDNSMLLKLAQHVIKDIGNGDCSVEALQTSGIQENKPFTSALAIATITEVAKPWSKPKRTVDTMLTPCSQMIKDVFKSLDPLVVVNTVCQSLDFTDLISSMAGIINTFLEIDIELVAAETPTVDLILMERYFEILRVLPIEFLSQGFQTIVLFCSIALALSLQTSELGDEDRKKKTMQLLHQNVVLGLLDGQNAAHVIPHLHAGLLIRRILDFELMPFQREPLLRVLFIQSLSDPISLSRLEEGIPLLRKGGAETAELHPKHIDAAAILKKTLWKYSLQVSNAACDKEQKAKCQKISRRLTRNLAGILKCSKMGDGQSLTSKLQLKIILVIIKECIAKKKNSKLDIISKCLRSVLKKLLIGVSNGDKECLKLMRILLRNHIQFKKALPTNFVLQASAVLSSNDHASIEVKMALLQAANYYQFKSITKELLKVTMNLTSGLSTKSDSKLEHFPTMWTSLVMSNLKDRKCRVRQVVLLELYTQLLIAVQRGHLTDIQTLLKFNLAIVNAHQVALTPEILDCFMESITALESENLISVVLALQLLSSLLYHCNAQVLDMIPAFVQRFSHLVTIVAKQGSQKENSTDDKYPEVIETCGLTIQKLASAIVKHDKQFHRIAQYILANILRQFEMFTLQFSVKMHLTNAVYSFLSICDTHAIAYLTHELPPASKEIFNTFYNNYKKYYRYTGKL